MYKSTVALALLVIEIVILIYYPKENKSKFFIYPQHWGFAFITLAFFLDASLVISRYIVQKTKKPGKYILPILGVIQQLRGPNCTQFSPPTTSSSGRDFTYHLS